MRRRSFLSGTVTVATCGLAGCLGDDGGQTDDEHLDALRSELEKREVAVDSVELDDDVVEVEHGYDEEPNDAIANVAMAFVDRIVDDWQVSRLEGHLRDEGNDWSWHADAEWAREYADGEIGPEEYGARISETTTMLTTVDDS